MSGPTLQVAGLAKAYAAPVLRAVDLEIGRGQVHALVGENGAGKSTLCRIVAGLAPADAGQMMLAGRPFRPTSRRDAEQRGVRLATQELNLLGTLSVGENLLLPELPARLGWIDRGALEKEAVRRLQRVGLGGLDPSRPLATLGLAARQLVEIAAALAHPCALLVLDEPTSSLGQAEAERLFAEIERAAAAGTAVLYVSHRLEEVRRIAARITVLRDGQVAATLPAAEAGTDQLVRLMVGRAPRDAAPSRSAPRGAPALSVQGLRSGTAVKDVTFTVHDGEILGLAGLVGSGRTETLRAVFGGDRREAGTIHLGSSSPPARIHSPRDAVRHGLGLVTEDRKTQGLLLPLSVRVNLTLTRLRALAGPLGFVRGGRERAAAQAHVDALAIRCTSAEQPVAELSGGNQQKVVLGRWLATSAAVLLLDEPTRGVDAGARLEIHQLLRSLAASGKAVVVVSSELEELLLLCDRIAVLSAGRVAAEFDREQFDRDRILAAALSGHAARTPA